MANPTTNYSFAMPTNIDLVKDLPADFEVFGQAVDTTLKALNPSTTLGDIEYRSSTANTNTRLGIGTTGQILTVAGGVPSWATASAGSMTSIATGSLSGTTTTLSSIAQTYKHLYLIIESPKVTVANPLLLQYNSNATGIYTTKGGQLSATTNITTTATTGFKPTHNTDDVPTTVVTSNYSFLFQNYALTNFKAVSMEVRVGSNIGSGSWNSTGVCNSTTAISSLQITTNAGTASYNGGTYTLYGVN